MKRLDEDFLKTAIQLINLAKRKRGRPRQAILRRAISTAYYGLFHALCQLCADSFIGTKRDTREAWRQVYRSVEHGHTRKMCDHKGMEKFPEDIRFFCDVFTQLQTKRHQADYDPFVRFTLKDADQAVTLAYIASALVKNVELKHRRAFAAWVLFRKPRQ